MADLSKSVAIVGTAESDEIGLVPNKSALQHHAEAAFNALEDAGLTKDDVDGLFTAGYSTLATADYMGIQPKFTDSTSIGGSSFIVHIAHAMAAINAGYCEVALITHGQTGRSARAPFPPDPNLPTMQYEFPYGFIGQPINYAMAANRYMHEYGEDRTRQALAEIAVSTRKWATLNPKAMMRDEMTFDDYHNSRWIAWPFHLLDCCLVTDAGAAVVVTSAERAKSLKKKPVWVLGAAEGHDHMGISTMPDLTSTYSRETGPAALAMAGVTHSDIDLAMIYDSFTYTAAVTAEMLGLTPRGEGASLWAEDAGPGGRFPVNTNGGGLSFSHSGMYGMMLLVEAQRQLAGTAEGLPGRQVEARSAVVNGTGGSLSTTATLVLTAD